MRSPEERRPDGGVEDDAPAANHPDLTAEIESARARVAASLSSLGDEVARRADPLAWVRARPALALVGALALGFLAGGGAAPPPGDG